MFPIRLENVRSILCLGAHPGDIEIGCGGTVLKLLAAQPGIAVYWAVLAAEGQHNDEAAKAAERILKDAGHRRVVLNDFREGFLARGGSEVRAFLRPLAGDIAPDLVFIHRADGADPDRRLVADLTRAAFADHLVLEYEVPTCDGGLGQPNLYVSLDEPTARRKVHAIVECFASLRSERRFAADVFWSLLSIRGLECASPTRMAEGFHCRKAVIMLNASPD